MAGERALPGLGLRAYWTPGSNDWETEHDPDTRLLSILVQAAVISRTTNLPTGANGDIYIVPVGQANENQIAAKDNGAWVYIVPKEGHLVHVNDTDEFVKWTGSAWEVLDAGGGGSAPTEVVVINKTASHTLELSDASGYIRMNVASANNLTVPPNGTVAFAVGAVVQVRQVGVGQTTVVAGSGVTVNTAETLKARKQGSTLTLVKVGTNEWDLTGDLEVAP